MGLLMIAPEGLGIGQIPKLKLAHQPEMTHTPCMGTHVFIWGDTVAEKGPPEGLCCKCGMFELHYSTCECGCGWVTMSLRFKQQRIDLAGAATVQVESGAMGGDMENESDKSSGTVQRASRYRDYAFRRKRATPNGANHV
jgi:hypothetical protein